MRSVDLLISGDVVTIAVLRKHEQIERMSSRWGFMPI